MNSTLYQRTKADWYPMYKLQGAAGCMVALHEWQVFSYAALAAMITVICEGDKNEMVS